MSAFSWVRDAVKAVDKATRAPFSALRRAYVHRVNKRRMELALEEKPEQKDESSPER